MSLRRLFLLSATLVSGAFTLLVVCREQKARVLQLQTCGLFTAQQILDRAGPLCSLLASQEAALTLSVQRTSEEVPLPAWSVEATDASGRDRIHLTWNAATGQLYSVGLPPGEEPERTAAPGPTAR